MAQIAVILLSLAEAAVSVLTPHALGWPLSFPDDCQPAVDGCSAICLPRGLWTGPKCPGVGNGSAHGGAAYLSVGSETGKEWRMLLLLKAAPRALEGVMESRYAVMGVPNAQCLQEEFTGSAQHGALQCHTRPLVGLSLGDRRDG